MYIIMDSATRSKQLLNRGYDVMYEVRQGLVVVYRRPSGEQRGSQYYVRSGESIKIKDRIPVDTVYKYL